MINLEKQSLTYINALQKNRNTKVISYILADTQPFATTIADDVLPILRKHLERFGKQDTVSLLLYTSGGDMLAPFKIVSVIRQYCKHFEVLIPDKAHSAGTLLTLGADKLVMGSTAHLSPVDPTTSHPFNPKDTTNKPIGISVEDVNSYFMFLKEQLKLTEKEYMFRAMELLVKEVHPLALGNIYRGSRMAIKLSERLLGLHLDPDKDKVKIKHIVDTLSKDIPIHNYPIFRDEAKKMGLDIEIPSKYVEDAMYALFGLYKEHVELGKGFNPIALLGSNKQVNSVRVGALIESDAGRDDFTFDINILNPAPPEAPPTPKVNMNVSWKEV